MHLDPILAHARVRLEERLRSHDLDAAVATARPALPAAQMLRTGAGPALIAEFKRRSPSRGDIAPERDPVATAEAYVRAGARAVSCLTEPRFFSGSDGDLTRIRAALPDVPLLRKDFILDPLQVREARALGADLCLLIVRALPLGLRACLEEAQALGMTALVEVHDEDELHAALDAGARVVGINNRDLDTFEVNLGTSERLLPLVPSEVLKVAESGIQGPDDVERMARAGADAILVGESLMRNPEFAAVLAKAGSA